jgi:hypothetical protein
MNQRPTLAHPSILAPSPLVPSLERRVARAMAHARLQAELRSIVLDLLAPCEPGELPRDLGRWVEDSAETVAAAVCDRTIDTLIRALDVTVGHAPPTLVQRLNVIAVRHDAGLF